jgi:uncharacterized protein YceK
MSRAHTTSSASNARPLGLRARRITAAMLGAGAALGILLSGCGSATSTTVAKKAAAVHPAGLTKAQFIADANAICAKSDPLLSEATAKLAAVRSRTELAAIVDSTYVPAIEAQLRAIATLGMPQGEQAAVTGMLKLVQNDLARLRRDPALVNSDVFGDFARVAHPYGLTSCAPLS